MQTELCKGFVHESIKELVLITFKGAKIDEIHFPLYGGSPCMVSFDLHGGSTKFGHVFQVFYFDL